MTMNANARPATTAVGVVGAGTMGTGIAQIAATAGWQVMLADLDADFVRRQVAGIRKNLDRLVEKGRLDAAARDAAMARIHVAAGPADFSSAELVIEAVVEDMSAKCAALRPVVAAAPAAIIASNTSSLSISKLGAALGVASRAVGMHFFNPVPLMPLVEVIAGSESDAAAVERVFAVAQQWGKTAVRAKDSPGFIVNRVARGYYLESLRMLGEGVAGVDEIDRTLKTLGGFRMGPFELMDLIGIDVNYSVSVSVWEQLGRPARLTPHELQKQLFEAGRFGRKTKRGFYSYEGESPLPATCVARASFALPPKLYEAVRRVCERATEASGSQTEQYVFARVLAAIINEAALLVDEGIATAADVDTAMKLGTNYPRGPLEWAERIGRHTCAALLRALNEQAGDGRFRPAAGLA
ncbi:MAG: 3-hydroxyacyl-CoA dehydrogenase NAD-binding domain-containing protein [Phycisphaerae bacterium]